MCQPDDKTALNAEGNVVEVFGETDQSRTLAWLGIVDGPAALLAQFSSGGTLALCATTTDVHTTKLVFGRGGETRHDLAFCVIMQTLRHRERRKIVLCVLCTESQKERNVGEKCTRSRPYSLHYALLFTLNVPHRAVSQEPRSP